MDGDFLLSNEIDSSPPNLAALREYLWSEYVLKLKIVWTPCIFYQLLAGQMENGAIRIQ